MQTHTENKLFALLSQEHNSTALESDMQEIERIVCADDLVLLRKVKNELTFLYARTKNTNDLLLQGLDERLSQFPNPEDPGLTKGGKKRKVYLRQQLPNGNSFCQMCGGRHPERPLFTAKPPTGPAVWCGNCEQIAKLKAGEIPSQLEKIHAEK